ncbi:hypothetical protein K2173_002441 [Erythroxylum novogranatense]|uniref:Thioredoxin domain-containing protein n=1 Tax=Erythroxylum novogranatense TaxID=1862640 RepID=A0AAV8TA41_9ROSI|nr:hypothetical protein K2173_002441 [Erythroxylum novogranatense]
MAAISTFIRSPLAPSLSSVSLSNSVYSSTFLCIPPSTPRNLVLKLGPPLPLKVLCARGSRAAVVTKESWENSILESDIPVLVEFYASWCGPCKMVHRVIDEIAGEYDGRLKCFVLNTDSDIQIAEDNEIKAVPVVLLFKNGKKQESVVGTMPKEFYIAAIERVLQL